MIITQKKRKNIYWNYHEDWAELVWFDETIIFINNRLTLNVEKEKFDFRNTKALPSPSALHLFARCGKICNWEGLKWTHLFAGLKKQVTQSSRGLTPCWSTSRST
ncbi:MAG: DUF5412 domain-containing protein [Oscillospiraceae bacterium]|nr:DUF5412 domain-containing protein [Oscillospiraceae bacterium]